MRALLVIGITVVCASGATVSRDYASVPTPPSQESYVRDERALLVLGKALFWDMQLSSDSRVACASCHFHAGADHRLYDQLSSSKGLAHSPRVLSSTDFPLARKAIEAGDRISSAGIPSRRFGGAGRDGLPDEAVPVPAGSHVRQVASRNAPSVINAVDYFRNFWDGRANNVFNGRTPYGDDDPAARILVEDRDTLALRRAHIDDASLASQAVEPPINGKEMSFDGRSWPFIGRKLLSARPLAKQRVAPDDSVLGPYVKGAPRGLSPDLSYFALVRTAFRPEFWSSNQLVSGDGQLLGRTAPRGPADFSQAEYNFPLFFGLAIQAYESTLTSNDSPYDRFVNGDANALTYIERQGLGMFRRNRCASCHVEPDLTLATRASARGSADYAGLGPDAGFFNTGVEPADNDIGLGARDPFGNFLSATARKRETAAQWMRGTFKTPNLRNVELTGPYFHTGSKATLEQIIEFYTFGGDYSAPALVPWGPDPMERTAMPALLKALTDDRVRFERAPFDHPELCVASAPKSSDPNAGERWAAVPEVGARGNRVPLQTFDELLRGIGKDGSRAHNLTAACSIP